jgi:glycosyltransferase involved in cell wall biosynthesis
MQPRGGTELLYSNLLKYCGTDWQKDKNLILSFCNPTLIHPTKTNIVWQHLMHDQGAIVGMYQQEFIDSVDRFVYVSNWQLDQFRNKFNIANADNIVIKNAIDPIFYKEKPKGKLKLIYTSMPNRGLDILLDAFALVDRDVELSIYSSNIIYGKSYSDAVGNRDSLLFARARSMKNVSYKGFVLNKVVRSALQDAHILAYPSTYEETSCIAAIEAGAAGCRIVTTDLGALPETCNQYAHYVKHTLDRQTLVENYATALIENIDNYYENSYTLENQSAWFNKQYSWENRSKEWTQFLNA